MRHSVYVHRADIRISDLGVPGEPPPMGTAARVRESIRSACPETRWGTPEIGILKGACYSIQFDLPHSAEVNHVMIEVDHAHAPGDCEAPADVIRALCTINRWAYQNLEDDGFLLVTER